MSPGDENVIGINAFNQKSEKLFSRYTYLDGCGKFFGDFCPNIFFLQLSKRMGQKKQQQQQQQQQQTNKNKNKKKHFFLRFLKNTILSKKWRFK